MVHLCVTVATFSDLMDSHPEAAMCVINIETRVLVVRERLFDGTWATKEVPGVIIYFVYTLFLHRKFQSSVLCWSTSLLLISPPAPSIPKLLAEFPGGQEVFQLISAVSSLHVSCQHELRWHTMTRWGPFGAGTGCLQMMVFRPSSLRCLMWDIVCFIAIVYDTAPWCARWSPPLRMIDGGPNI